MPAALSVPVPWRDRVQAVLREEGVDLALVTPPAEATVEIVESRGSERALADPATLPAGGAIRCVTALSMAGRLGIPTRTLGALLDVLDVKVKDCSLGCFK